MSDRTVGQRLDAIEQRLAQMDGNMGLFAKMLRDIAYALNVRDRIREDLDELEKANGRDTEPAPPPAEGE